MNDFNEKYQAKFGKPFYEEPQSESSINQKVPLELQLDRKLAIVKMQNAEINTPNNQQLLDTPLLELINEYGLQRLGEFERAFNLYVWLGNLQDELEDITPKHYGSDRASYNNRVSTLNKKIAETKKHLNSFDNGEHINKNNNAEPIENNLKNEELEVFIKSIIADYPEATSKDILAHCFECYKTNNRQKEKIKKIMLGLGVRMDSIAGVRTSESIKYMAKAEIFNSQ